MAELKKIDFNIRILESTPTVINTDITRLQQIIKNLLSNAFKFTSQGKVMLTIGMAKGGWTHDHPVLSKANGVIAFSVEDSGVGIAADKLQLIFEAFQQADGSTARKYGGTGLGLSISRELARLLTGEIHVSSKIGEGSIFTLFLPLTVGDIDPNYVVQSSNGLSSFITSEKIFDIPETLDTPVLGESENLPTMIAAPSRIGSSSQMGSYSLMDSPGMVGGSTIIVPPSMISTPGGEAVYGEQIDDRAKITSTDNSVLIIEGNPEIALQLINQTRQTGFKGIITFNGDSALSLARDYLPIAIFLDVDTLGFDGYVILDRLKRDLNTRNIPVHIISNDKNRDISLQKGAISHLTKPLANETINSEFSYIKQFIVREKRNLLIVEDDEVQKNSLITLIGNDDINISAVETGKEALEILSQKDFDCVVLDLTLPDIDGLSLLEKIGEIPSLRNLPIIIYTAKDLNRKDLAKLKRVAKTIVVKDARSPERLFNETALYLHRSYTNLSKKQQQIINQIHSDDHALAGKKVLIVDDDIRNIFALSSVLEKQEMRVLHAENGKTGIDVLENNPGIEIVLMDIMMPEMDGYDTMKVIRKIPKFKSLPIITLTAKAMKGDRDKCIAAGASDYITKPVDVAKLLSMMRTWLYK